MNLDVKFSSKDYSWLCFRHAVSEAQKGENIEVEIDDWYSGRYMGSTFCTLCGIEIDENNQTSTSSTAEE